MLECLDLKLYFPMEIYILLQVIAICRRSFVDFLKPVKKFFKYELNDYKYDKELEISFICGAFSIVRMNVFKDIGFFDERFFFIKKI